MQEIYKQVAIKYKQLTTSLLKENEQLIKSNNSYRSNKLQIFKRDKAIIPFIRSSSKSNFMSYSTTNIFTQDDPILRYVPTIRFEQPSSIIWFESTIFGSKSFDKDDMIDLLVIRMLEKRGHEQKALEFISTNFGRNREEFLRIKKKGYKLNINDLFCSICLVFGCGIHSVKNTKILKFSEKIECCCSSIVTDFKLDEILQFIPERKYCLKPCVLSKLIQIKHNLLIPCKYMNTSKLPQVKTVSLSKSFTDPKQFYQVCDHSGKCYDKKCSCQINNTLCESFCSCTSCSNVIFCNCKVCDKDCVCLLAHRECTDLCKCKILKECNNKPILMNFKTKISIGRSLKHGLGLFAEQFIPANTFVIEYTGELITDKEAERRGNFYEMNKLSYLFNAIFKNSDCLYSIDAFFVGNKSRFINHSVSKANLKSKILVSHGNVKIVFYSITDIYKGDEFLFDYQFSDEEKAKHGILD